MNVSRSTILKPQSTSSGRSAGSGPSRTLRPRHPRRPRGAARRGSPEPDPSLAPDQRVSQRPEVRILRRESPAGDDGHRVADDERSGCLAAPPRSGGPPSGPGPVHASSRPATSAWSASDSSTPSTAGSVGGRPVEVEVRPARRHPGPTYRCIARGSSDANVVLAVDAGKTDSSNCRPMPSPSASAARTDRRGERPARCRRDAPKPIIDVARDRHHDRAASQQMRRYWS